MQNDFIQSNAPFLEATTFSHLTDALPKHKYSRFVKHEISSASDIFLKRAGTSFFSFLFPYPI